VDFLACNGRLLRDGELVANNISLHLKNSYKDKELYEEATTEDFSVVRQPDF